MGTDHNQLDTFTSANNHFTSMESQSASLKMLQASQGKSETKGPSGLETGAINLGSTLGAGTAGSALWAVLSGSEIGLPAKLLMTAAASGATRTLIQGVSEHFLLKPNERHSLTSDFAWGTVDGLAAVAGSAAEAKVNSALTARLGRHFLGDGISEDLAATAGRKAIENSLGSKLVVNSARGVAGGAVGSFAWSIPHAFYDNHNDLATSKGWLHTAESVGVNTAFGAVSGGLIAGGLTAAKNARDVAGYASAALKGDAGVTKVNLLHFNDMHSALLGENGSLPQMATTINESRAAAAAKGMSSLVYDDGDNFSGNVAAGFTKTGYVETKAINMMGVDAFVPGNHVADAGAGEVNVDAWVQNAHQLNQEMARELPAIGANIDLPRYPGFIGPEGSVYKPYRISTIIGADGQEEKVAHLGLVTKELADAAKNNDITYLDAQAEAQKWIAHINKPVSEGGEGVNKIIVLSHMGRQEDIELAKNVKGISYIAGAHSHDAEPVPIWVKNSETGADVPIVQAGESAKWVGNTELAFKPDGMADKYRTAGSLLQTKDAAPDPIIKSFIDEHVAPVRELENVKYNADIVGPFPIEGIRGQYLRQTTLGTLVSRGVLDETNNQLPALNEARVAAGQQPIPHLQAMLKHTGDVRAGVEGPQTRRTLSDVFLNTGSDDREKRELAAITLSGSDIKKVLDFGVSDFPTPSHLGQANQSFGSKMRSGLSTLFGGAKQEPFHDYSGNFIQTENMKYSIDLSKPIGSRVGDIQIWNPATSKFEPVQPDANYDLLTLNHAVEKWAKKGVFGEDIRKGGEAAVHQYASVKPIPLSQVELMADYLTKNSPIRPTDYISDNVMNMTPKKWDPQVRPNIYTLGTLSVESAKENKSGN